MANCKVTILKDHVNDFVKDVHNLASKRVLIGIPSTRAARKLIDEETGKVTANSETDTEVNNAELGFIHEFGSPAANIPARPFLQPGVNAAMPKIAKIFERAGKAALDGDTATVDKAFDAVGLVAQSSVKMYLRSGNGMAPLKPATVIARARRRAGVSANGKVRKTLTVWSIAPLIDTAQMLNSITYAVREKE